MRVLLVNPRHTAIGSRIPDDHLPPLGLLCVGGSLIDAGHEVELLDADRLDLGVDEVVEAIVAKEPDALLMGHSGSTSAHPTVAEITRRVRERLHAWIVYGGVFPSYHWRDVLAAEPQIDVVVRGEGEAIAPAVMRALEDGAPLAAIEGVAFQTPDGPVSTRGAPAIRDLDAFRVGWELIDFADYSYYGGKRAVVVQFSRGCPHKCTYCGQRDFWTHWRHRDPERLAAEIAWLHREHGVELVNLADENPTASRRHWLAFLDALIAEGVDVSIIGSTRADDIVRDADLLHRYRQAGVERFLLGMENTDPETLRRIRKGGSTTSDREAIRLLRENGILSMATWVVGFDEETPASLLTGLRQILAYDPDQIQALYITPHRWTPFFEEAEERRVIQPDARRWDYKHQVLATEKMSPAALFGWVKAIEVIVQSRPRALQRILAHPDPRLRHGMRWYTKMGRRVWFHEVAEFLRDRRHVVDGPRLGELWGEAQSGVLRPFRRRVA